MTTARASHPSRRSAPAGAVAAATAVGVVLGGVMAATAVVRRSKPVHPRGAVVDARLAVTAEEAALGALGTPGVLPVVARFSRAVGLPPGWPDLQGLALRWSGASGPNDLLLASTRAGRIGRFLLSVRRRARGSFGSLMPFATALGPVVVSAVPVPGEWALELRWAVGLGRWRPVGVLRWERPPAADALLRFEPVGNCPDGLATYPWADRLRRYAYGWSRATWRG
ncbi:hypothetical protein [Georgenia sp. AZ-5]|uniref:hypothetical protein n=1 Tax=Georgenia sp. AZ-5 TaxID=3367526 RepID=UPI003754FF92